MADPPRLFNQDLHRARLTRAAQRFEGFLKARAAEDIVQRLTAINRHFGVAVDLGARTGGFAEALAHGGLEGKIDWLAQADTSSAMLLRTDGPRFVADEARLPLREASVDLIVSSLALHWIDDLVGALIQVRRALKPDGLFIGALLGGATLTELRQCLTEAEVEVVGGAGPRISPFLDAFDGAGLLQRAGFALPVADVDTVTVTYDHPLKLLADLRAMGETNVLVDRPQSPLTRRVVARAAELYRQRFAADDGRVGATFEIVTLTGWAPHPDQQQPLRPGTARARLADALGVKEHGAGEEAGS